MKKSPTLFSDVLPFALMLLTAVTVVALDEPLVRADPVPLPAPNGQCCGEDMSNCCGCVVTTAFVGGNNEPRYVQATDNSGAAYMRCQTNPDPTPGSCTNVNQVCYNLTNTKVWGSRSGSSCSSTCGNDLNQLLTEQINRPMCDRSENTVCD